MSEFTAGEAEIWVGPAAMADPANLGRYAAMVASGGQVPGMGLMRRIRDAHFIALATKAGTLVGGAALKRPATAYVERVFRSAGAPFPDGDVVELGYLFVDESRRGHGLAGRLLATLVARRDNHEAFATAREQNLVARRCLERCGFVRHGRSYLSADGRGQITLYSHAT